MPPSHGARSGRLPSGRLIRLIRLVTG